MAEKFKNLINGKWVEPSSGKYFKNINPANKEDLLGVFPDSTATDVHKAVESAHAAFEKWSKITAPKRGEIILKAGQLLLKRKEILAQTATKEMGKILIETKGDVQEGIDTALYMAGEGRRLFGQTTPSELSNKFAMSLRAPIGVVGIISPWNFPVAIPAWKIFPALICGNTIVFKPATDTPESALRLVEILIEAGVPDGVVNLVFGSGSEVGKAIVTHPKISLISFTGSSETGRFIASECGKRLKKCALEMGGKNAQIVMNDADIDLAIDGALWGIFGTTGQRCTATSRLIIHKKILDEFTHRLITRAKKIRIGNGLDESTEMGPLINEAQRQKVHNYVNIGINEDRAKLLIGGESCNNRECSKGFFYKPTIFTNGNIKMRIAQEEIFGPVVIIIPVKDFNEAIAAINSSKYGLSASIYTKDINMAFKAIERIKSGIVYVNSPTIGAESHLPFGGIKDTGNGHREAGVTALDIFSEWKTVYIDYSGRLQRAQIDTDK
ncbi:MAG: aldehyde dehydrogenase [Candidatus Schekmanbacteria bacterium RIFCSPLOWO2_02_FULL_38_14]|uniref:aldehyde dehydrogenase (NAD(+)) n=1 Tax=Candidatus Schekmanbacteria bacterium RIFCSPLOWO2_12_FULL_38_15 TaxID=1817883 RepID=A0A1F7SI39_9BACT|nr:MAG: aldehyde dehydrogenase [Candidatus Schekmanbacteria bacterium RIFCSPLOWO2_02_FULL_38_14]OGL53450.1 MAG: aldehyde dehydrogenase [Candidatus Schekmanbacteria bacterium RIFCSPLOWO2_12_FULL_38_15]